MRGAGTPFLIAGHRHLGQAGDSNARYTHRTALSQVGAPVRLPPPQGKLSHAQAPCVSSRLPGEEPGDPSSRAAGLLLEGCMCIKPGAWGEGSGNKLETPLPHTHKETSTACCYCDLHSPGHFLTVKEAPCGWLDLEGVAGYSRLKWCPGPALIWVRKTAPHLSSAQRPSLWKTRGQEDTASSAHTRREQGSCGLGAWSL